MCGIAGFVHLARDREVSRDRLQKMTDLLSHRGPDDQGSFVHRNVALGHRRLSIIDPEGGGQPMRDRDRSLVITSNAEIYNYVELREELKLEGHRFATSSYSQVRRLASRNPPRLDLTTPWSRIRRCTIGLSTRSLNDRSVGTPRL